MSKRTNIRHYDLDKIKLEFLKYAPAYAQEEAKQAIYKIAELQSQGIIRNGLYYVVLVDLVGSTKFTAAHGNKKAANRIKVFVTSSFRALNAIKLSNVGLFVKEIGDAVLYIFQHFPDVVRWRSSFAEFLRVFSSAGETEPFQIRTCVHLGEVFLQGVNPLSLAVSQTFKMEKKVQAGDIVLTDPAFHVAWPTLARAYHGFRGYGDVELDGFPEPVRLHQLVARDSEDLVRALEETLE